MRNKANALIKSRFSLEKVDLKGMVNDIPRVVEVDRFEDASAVVLGCVTHGGKIKLIVIRGPRIILEGAMGKIALNFSKWPLNYEIMGQFYNVRV